MSSKAKKFDETILIGQSINPITPILINITINAFKSIMVTGQKSLNIK